MNPEISVIIPALNEEKYIAHPLGGLSRQTFKNFETIVVDGGSRDRTVKIASGKARVIVERKRGPAAARNAGAAIAKGKVLVFLDADTRPSPRLLETFSKAFGSMHIIAATGPILPLEKTRRVVGAGYRFVSILFVRFSILIGMPSIVGANFAVRRREFIREGGFNENMLTYEDWDLSMRLRKLGRICFLKNAIVHTSVRRISEWGIVGFLKYYTGNIARYTLFKKPKEDYKAVR